MHRARWLLVFGLFAILAHGQDPAVVQIAPAHPSQPSAPPDVRTLMLEVEQNQKSTESLSRDYTYRVHTVREELTSSGQVKKTVVTDAESFTIDGVRVNKVVRRDGKPLTPDEQKKEDEAVDKTVKRAREERAKLASKAKPTNAQGDEVLTVSRMLELGTFSALRAGEFAGRPAWLIDYTGNLNAKTRTEFEKVFRDLVGTIWIDQKDHVVVAAKGHFLNDFKIGGGLLASVSKSTHFDFRFTKVDGKAWVVDSFDGEGSFHYLLFGGFNGRIHTQTSDYKRFRSEAKLNPNVQEVDADGKPIQQPSQVHP